MSAHLVAVIRHGAYQQKADTPSALQPFALTEEGATEVRVQAQKFALILRENGWQLHCEVHSSPLLRAWQTAQIYIEELADFFLQPPTHLEFPELCERSVGNVANLTIAEIEGILKDDPRYELAPTNWKSDSHYRLPFMGAESLLQAGERVAKHISTTVHTLKTVHTATTDQYAASAHQHKKVRLIIGHGAAIRHAACHLGVMDVADAGTLSMYHAHPVVLQFDGRNWRHIAGQWKRRAPKEDAED